MSARDKNLQPPEQVPKLAVSAIEVAEMLSISVGHVWKLHSRGKLPKPVRLDRSVRWDRRALEVWFAAGAPRRDRWEAMRSYGDARPPVTAH